MQPGSSGSLWQAVLGEIELSLSRGNFVTWFKNTQLLQQTDEVVVIGVTNVFIKGQLERRYNSLIMETLGKNGITPRRIEYRIASMPKSSETKPANSPAALLSSAPPSSQAVFPGTRPHMPASNQSQSPFAVSPPSTGSGNTISHNYRQGLNEKYVFDSFIVGAGNELAYAACQAIASQPGTKYNPLFIYGGVGIGKTHLIQAVGNAVLAKNPNASIVYASTEQFVQEFVDALRFKKTTDFAKHYRGADVLIVDDMQFIAGKEKIQEEFFHTFNALHQANKQIIISSDKPPRDIPTLEERLQSRFAWGMTIDMQNPDFETRCAIVQTKANGHNIVLPADVVEFLAKLVQTNIRELEGALNQLLAFCEMRELQPDLQTASSLLGGTKARPKHVNARQIIERTARHFQVSIEDILGPKRDKDIVVPRQIAMYMLRSELHMSFPKIAHELGRKDHTTAMHSVEKIVKESQLDAELRETLQSLKELLYA
jgi:chromosomal replication initiator protein